MPLQLENYPSKSQTPHEVVSPSALCAQATITEFGSLDNQRITYLRAVLGSTAVARPQINIGSAFAAAANMALGTTLSPAFSPYGDDLSFLEGAFFLGDLQVTLAPQCKSLWQIASSYRASHPLC